jgi:hypothetical protein
MVKHVMRKRRTKLSKKSTRPKRTKSRKPRRTVKRTKSKSKSRKKKSRSKKLKGGNEGVGFRLTSDSIGGLSRVERVENCKSGMRSNFL